MDAVLLAGGYGTRLRPLTYTRPKPLLPVAGRPMVDWVLDRLPDEVDRVIVAVNWLAAELEKHFAQSEQAMEFVVVRENEPLGTAGAVKNCASHIESDDFLVLNADIVSDMDLDALVNLRRVEEGNAISLKEVPRQDVVNFGVIQKAGGPGCAEIPEAVRIAGFVEKPKDPTMAPSNLVNAGAYALHRSVLDLIPAGKLVSMEKEIFPQLIPRGFWGMPFVGTWIDVGDPVRLRLAAQRLDPGYKVGPHSTISADAKLNQTVGGSRCHVGAGAVLERCVLGDRVTIRPGVKLVDCMVGDDETVHASAEGQRIWTKPVPAGYPKQQVGNAL